MTGFEDLPGADLVLGGIADVERGETTTIASLLVQIAAPRLRRVGLPIPKFDGPQDAEQRLYERIGQSGALDPYGEYNALLRRLSSFAQALERRQSARADSEAKSARR